MDFYNEFLERLRNGDDANVIANEITKALNDSIKAKADEDKKAEKAKLDAEIKVRRAKVLDAEDDMNDYLDVMIEYVNDYLSAYADAHERKNVESMNKDELRSLLDSWAELHGWINKVSKMDMNDVLDELGSLWTDLGIAKKVGVKSQPSADIYAKTEVSTDDLDKIYGKTNVKANVKSYPTDGIYAKADLNDVEKTIVKGCDCDKECKKPIKTTTVHIKDDMSADDIINEFLKALDKF